MKHTRSLLLAAGTALVAGAGVVSAHVTVQTTNVPSNVASVVTFQIAHGCSQVNGPNDSAMKDTKSLEIDIPTDGTNNVVKSVRALPSTLGPASVTTDGNAKVTAVTWTNPNLAAADVNFYTVQLRFTPATDPVSGTSVPAPTFSQITFTAKQICEDPATHNTATVWWDGLKHADPFQAGTTCNADGDCAAGTTCATAAHTCMLPAEPAPVLTVVANRQPGWNHYQITTHIPDPSVYFSDAQIVWMLTAQEGCSKPPCAFSANPTVAAAIATTSGVTPATGGIHPDGDIWVKY